MTTLTDALADPRPSVRLRAVMAAGTTPDPADLSVLVERCAVEPDFGVREALTWALIRLPASHVVPRVLPELGSAVPQARSQALHTLSKIRDGSVYPSVVPLLDDRDPDVVRTAWRAAVVLVPEDDDERAALARRLGTQLGHGDRDTRLALSRALVGLGEAAVAPVLEAASRRGTAAREHAADTERLLHDPDAGSSLALERARREVALGRTRSAKG